MRTWVTFGSSRQGTKESSLTPAAHLVLSARRRACARWPLNKSRTFSKGKRIAFTGDLGFENQDILHRCWGDAPKAREVARVVRNKLLPWRPDVVFTGHGVRTNGTEFLAQLVRQTEQSLGLLTPAEAKSN